MSAQAQSNIVYAVEYNQSTNRFGTINLYNGSFTKISSFGNVMINDIAFCPTNEMLYGISNSLALVTFNKTNGAMTRVATISVSGIESLAFRPGDGALFGATQSKLYTINPANGTATLIGSYGTPQNLGTTGQNIRFAQDGNLYVSNTSTNTDIYRISTSSGAATWMGEAVGFPYLMLENASQNMYGVFINLKSGTSGYPELATFNLSSFVSGGTNANGSTHQITITLVGAGTNFPPNFNFSGDVPQIITNLTVPVSATGPSNQTSVVGSNVVFSTLASGTGPYNYSWLKNGTAIGGQINSSLTLNNVTTNDAAAYSVVVGGAIGTVTNSATLTVNVPVTVTVPPVSQTAIVGSNVTFSVTATGTGLSYQWLFGGSLVGSSSSLTLNSVTTGQAGTYTVIVSGAGTPVTNSATLTVNVPVTVTVPPVSQTAIVGSNVTFSVTATGTGLSYQWLFGGSLVGSSSSLTLNNVTTGQAGTYTVIVSGAGTPVTNSATLTVNVPVTVTVPPVSQTAIVGSNVTFSVTATGTGLSYQWLFGGSLLGTSSSLTLNNVTTGQAGTYTVIVSGAGTPVTNSATLTVNVPVTVTVPPVSQTAIVGSNVTFSVTATGTGLSYQWLFGGSLVGSSSSLTLNNVTTGQAGTYTVIVSGAGTPVTNSATLTVNVPVTVTVPPVSQTAIVGSNVTFSVTATGTGLSYQWLFGGSSVGSSSSLTLNNVTTGQAGTYTVIVSGAGTPVTNSATLTVNVPVTVTVPPVSQTAIVGSNVTFSVTATGTGLSYQWLFGGSSLGSSSSLTLNNVTTGQAGTYTVIVSGAGTPVTNSATLTVNVPVTVTVPPVSQTAIVGSNVTFSVTATGTGLSYQWLFGGSSVGSSSSLTLNNVTTGQAGTYTVIVSGAGTPVTNSATLTVNVPVTVTVPPVSQTAIVGSNVTFSVTATGTGLSYQWLFGGSSVGSSSSLTLNNVTTGQAGTYTVIVSGAGTPVTNSATLTVNVPVTVTVPPVSQTAIVGSNVTFSVTATGTGLSYQWLFGGSSVGSSSSLTLNSVTTGQAGTYTVIVSGAGTPVTNSATLTVNVPVTVTVPPVSQTAIVGSNVTFSVTATGTGLSYQWLFGGSSVGSSSSLTLNSVTTGQAGTYTVIVSGAGTPVTNSATLTVNVPVTVTVPPVSQTAIVGSNVTFSVTATGTGLSYQWLFGGSSVGSSSSLTLNSVTTGQAGTYTVIVSGAGTPVTNSATLTVNVPVTVTVPPVSQTAIVGSNVTFSVTATGTGLSYQWLFGGSLVGSSSSLTLNSVTTGQAGTYTVIVSGAGTPVTNSATLTVNVPVTATPLSSMVVYQGENAAFSTAASGTGPLNYVWMKNGGVISGQVGNSLTLNNVTTNDTATYSVIVAGACDSVTNSANLTVNPASSPTLSIVNMRNGTVNISAANGAPGQSFVLLVSTNLVNWTIVSTNTADSTGASTFAGLDATNHLHYFYRTVTP